MKEDLKKRFNLDIQRLNNDKLHPLDPWISDHNGRLGIAILADSINYSINYGKPEMYKMYEQPIKIAYLMKVNI